MDSNCISLIYSSLFKQCNRSSIDCTAFICSIGSACCVTEMVLCSSYEFVAMGSSIFFFFIRVTVLVPKVTMCEPSPAMWSSIFFL